MIKKTYLSGRMTGMSDAECVVWREEAKSKLMTKCLDPMIRDFRGKEDTVDHAWLINEDLKDIFSSDYLLINAVLPGWGTAMEVLYAYEARKPMLVAFTECDPTFASPWLKGHTDKIVCSLQEAIDIINKDVITQESKPIYADMQ